MPAGGQVKQQHFDLEQKPLPRLGMAQEADQGEQLLAPTEGDDVHHLDYQDSPATFVDLCTLQPQAVGRFYSLHERLIAAHKWDRSDSLDSFRSHDQRSYPEHVILQCNCISTIGTT